ncbi:hypothetical protein [Thalassorhabdomicrobium marinisediminis]|uniref:hypothetical protein n=1 Tax=Thalassorhabdomicrobium marinisediminis TaxID=2170577 RepID=UPI002491C3E6|nr:hypothetical protein [Thalassorhabdomicrobium marinisediminis]
MSRKNTTNDSSGARLLVVIAALALLGVLGFIYGSKWWLTRLPEGEDCPEVSVIDGLPDDLDFTPRFTEEKQIMQFEVRTSAGQEMPDCAMTESAFRCSVRGPVMIRTKIWNNDLRYFPVGSGEDAIVLGTEKYVACTITHRDGVELEWTPAGG